MHNSTVHKEFDFASSMAYRKVFFVSASEICQVQEK